MRVRGKCLECKVTIGLVLFGPGSIGQETFVLFALTFGKELLSFSRQTEFVVVAVLCCVVVVVFVFASASLVLYMQFLHSLHKTLQE